MSYDDRVPLALKKEQIWFGNIIGRPIDEDSRMNPISPSGHPMEVEAAEHIIPSPTLRPAQRIQIYNQQYWWRLLNTLHELFPLVTRLFGYYDFNRTIGIPYLVKYPPRHWSLALLGDRLEQWVKEEYVENDKELICHAISLDWAFSCGFIAPQSPPLDGKDLADIEKASVEILGKTLYTQPYLYPFDMRYDLFRYRVEFLKHDPDYWLSHEFPQLDCSKQFFFVLYRTQDHMIAWKEISHGEYLLLNLFKSGATIDEACEWLENQDQSLCEMAMSHLHLWFQEWTARGWLTTNHAS